MSDTQSPAPDTDAPPVDDPVGEPGPEPNQPIVA